MPAESLLSQLRSRSTVDCDTLNVSVAKELGPFQDCTSNQAIAYAELQEHRHKTLIQDANRLSAEISGRKDAARAVDIAMTMLALQMLPHIKGRAHIQVNPLFARSTLDMVDNARAIVSYARKINPVADASRLCIKIPSTWEGLQACRQLEQEGIRTLATTLFTVQQAIAAGEAGCTYIAPYVNELRVHFEPGYRDPDPGVTLVIEAQRQLHRHGYATKIMPASLTTVQEVMALAGADHITVAPHLLQKMHETVGGPDVARRFTSVFDAAAAEELAPEVGNANDEAAFRRALGGSKGGQNQRKLDEAIDIFCDFQRKLENMFEAAT